MAAGAAPASPTAFAVSVAAAGDVAAVSVTGGDAVLSSEPFNFSAAVFRPASRSAALGGDGVAGVGVVGSALALAADDASSVTGAGLAAADGVVVSATEAGAAGATAGVSDLRAMNPVVGDGATGVVARSAANGLLDVDDGLSPPLMPCEDGVGTGGADGRDPGGCSAMIRRIEARISSMLGSLLESSLVIRDPLKRARQIVWRGWCSPATDGNRTLPRRCACGTDLPTQ